MNILIVGGGIFTWSFLWQLSKHTTSFISSITLLDGSLRYPPCSLNSTGLIARRGNQFAVSELGDLIQDSWNWWEYNYALYQLGPKQGVTYAPLLYLNSTLLKRSNHLQSLSPCTGDTKLPQQLRVDAVSMERCLMIDPVKWLNFLQISTVENFTRRKIKFEHVLESVQSIDLDMAQAVTGKNTYNAQKIILQNGAYKLVTLPQIEKEEIVYGAFLEFENLSDWRNESFSFSSTYQLNYNKMSQHLQIGIFSATKSNQSEVESVLLQLYNTASQEGWDLPPHHQAKILIGARLKLKKRLPVIGKEKNCYYHLGGYKIGYLVSLFQSQQLINLMLNDKT